jgi:hypothetical protein
MHDLGLFEPCPTIAVDLNSEKTERKRTDLHARGRALGVRLKNEILGKTPSPAPVFLKRRDEITANRPG